MKITKSQLKQIIKEELNETYDSQLTPEQEEVQELIFQLADKIDAMGDSNPEMTDAYVLLFRQLQAAGVNVKMVALYAAP